MLNRDVKIKCRSTGAVFVVTCVTNRHVEYSNGKQNGKAVIDFINELFEVSNGG